MGTRYIFENFCHVREGLKNNSAFHLTSLHMEYVNYRKRTNFYHKHLDKKNDKHNIILTNKLILY